MSDDQAHRPGRDVSAWPGYYPGGIESTTNVENTTNVGVELDVGVTTIHVPPPAPFQPRGGLTVDRMLEIRSQIAAHFREEALIAREWREAHPPKPDHAGLTLGPPVQAAIAVPTPHVEQPTFSGIAVFLPVFLAVLAIMGVLKGIKLLRRGRANEAAG